MCSCEIKYPGPMLYQFGKGFWNQFEDVSPEEKTSLENDFPLFKAPGPETPEKIAVLLEACTSFKMCFDDQLRKGVNMPDLGAFDSPGLPHINEVGVLRGHPWEIFFVRFSPDGNLL